MDKHLQVKTTKWTQSSKAYTLEMQPNYSKRIFLRQGKGDNRQKDTQHCNSGNFKAKRQGTIELAGQRKSNPRPAVRKAEKE